VLLRDLTIENYRSFENYKLDGLARVNLLVGDNNCGKTSVLEAVELLCGHDPLVSLERIAFRRGEVVPAGSGMSFAKKTTETCAGFPTGRVVALGSLFKLFGRVESAAPSWELTALIETCPPQLARFVRETVEDESGKITDATEPHDESDDEESWQLRLTMRHGPVHGHRRVPVTGDGGLHMPYASGGAMARGSLPSRHGLHTVVCGLRGVEGADLINVWDQVIRRGQKPRVIAAMRLILPDLEDLDYMPSLVSNRNPNAGMVVRFNNEIGVGPIGLNSFGDGTQRLLGLVTTIAAGSSGLVLIDEIDTGLHYSKLSEMWRMIIKAAAELDVQVFATTHSLDCIRGLSDAVDREPDMTDQVAIFRIDRQTNEAVRFDGEELSVVASHEIEVR
jgi:hypothetical protein